VQSRARALVTLLPQDDATANGWFGVSGRPIAQRLVRIGMLVAAALTFAYCASLWLVTRPESRYLSVWDGWIATAVDVLPAIALVVAVLIYDDAQRAWLALTAAVSLNLIGNFVATHTETTGLGPADIFYLSGNVAMLIGVTLLTLQGAERLGSKHLDGAIAGLSAGAIAVALWFGSLLSPTGSTLEVAVGLAYPLFDLAFIVVIVAGLAPQRYRPTWRTGLLIAAVAMFAFGDIVFLRQTADDTYVKATWLESTWVIGYALTGVAPWVPSRRHHPIERLDDRRTSTIPVVFAAAALGVLMVAPFHRMQWLASVMAGAALALALARTLLTVRELRSANASRVEARTDFLTGLPNRRSFIEHLDGLLADPTDKIALLVIDLDRFKEVNDSLGHHAGDDLLVQVGRRLQVVLGENAFLARLGGDEFGVCLDVADAVQAVMTSELIMGCMNAPFALDGMRVQSACSIGIAVSPEHGNARSELFRHADVAMYQAKHLNHGGQAMYDPSLDTNRREQLELQEEVNRALAQDELVMYYQPQVALATGRVIGVEALVRWPHPRRGMLYPDLFLPALSRQGLLPKLTSFVLDRSLDEIANHNRTHPVRLMLSVNISGDDLLEETLPARVLEACERHGFAPTDLILEITETELVADLDRASVTIERLRAQGVRVSVDDFGVGYSSMAQLLALELDELKLDRSIVSAMERDERAFAIVRATIELARALNLSMVAEGAKTAAVVSMLTTAGCDVGQGSYFSLPLPLGELVPLLASNSFSSRS
jgi:diguanylate cyclase